MELRLFCSIVGPVKEFRLHLPVDSEAVEPTWVMPLMEALERLVSVGNIVSLTMRLEELGREHAAGNTVPGTLSPDSSDTRHVSSRRRLFFTAKILIKQERTITVRDNIGADDGYIFEWGILFNRSESKRRDLRDGGRFYLVEPRPNIVQFFGDTMVEASALVPTTSLLM